MNFKVVGTFCGLQFAFLLCLIPLVISALVLCNSATSQDASSIAPQQQLRLPEDLFSSDYTFPKITNGYFLSFRSHLDRQRSDSLRLHSIDFRSSHALGFWPFGSSAYWINGAAVMSGNRIVLAGVSQSAKDGNLLNFISTLDSNSGTALQTFATGEFEPAAVCSAKDGTIWALGESMSAEAAGEPYNLLRNYSSDGRLLAEFLARNAVPVKRLHLNLSRRLKFAGSRVGKVSLFCTDSSVTAYIGPGLTLGTVSLEDRVEHRWRVVPPGEKALMSGIAVLGDDSLYASFRLFETEGRAETRALCKLDLRSEGFGRWVLVPGTQTSPSVPNGFVRLLGADKSHLIYLQQIDSQALVSWTPDLLRH